MCSVQTLGLAMSIIDYNHVPIFLIWLTTDVNSQKKSTFCSTGKKSKSQNELYYTLQNRINYQRHNF